MTDTRHPLAVKRRTRSVAAGLLGALLLGGGGYFWLKGAWEATVLRDAFLPELETKARNEPSNIQVLTLLAGRYAEANDYASAATQLEQAIAAGETETDSWLTWSAALAASGDREQAGAVLQLAMKHPDAKAAARQAIERCKPLPNGVSPTELARAISPEGPAAYVAPRTQGSFLNGLSRDGFETRRARAQAAPNDTTAQTLWADALLKNRRYGEAGEIVEKVFETEPDRPDAQLIHAEAARYLGATAKAGLEYTAILKKQPENLTALLGMGSVALTKSLYPVAIEVFTRATKLAPSNADAWIGMGRAHYNQRLNFGASVDAFTKAQKLAPERTDFYLSFANAQRAIFHWAEAEALVRQRLRDAPNDAEADFQLAAILLDSNRTPERESEAEQLLRRSLKLEPGAVTAMARLGNLLVVHNNPKEAIPLLETVIGDDMYHVAATKDLAQAYRLAGRLKEAKQASESFVQLTQYIDRRNFLDDQIRRQPMNPALHEKLAALLEQGGETAKAKTHRDAALILRKDPAKAKRGLDILNHAMASTEIPESQK
ncbi:MAG: tetratricopeptide repeat protein [Armatimonas sp.]